VTAFQPFDLTHAATLDFRLQPFPTIVRTWCAEALTIPSQTATHFGYVHTGVAELSCASGTFRLAAGMYVSVAGEMNVNGGSGLVVTREDYRGFFHIGGPIEDRGRLLYIDGCTDSLLIAPVMRGDPCLNLLHIPPRSHQTAHTHPSLRVGVIARGHGECVTADERFPLRPGLAFVIAAGALHSFHTVGDELLVVAYHPDSDFGPTHECHPMVNRTIIPAFLPPPHPNPPPQGGRERDAEARP